MTDSLLVFMQYYFTKYYYYKNEFLNETVESLITNLKINISCLNVCLVIFDCIMCTAIIIILLSLKIIKVHQQD